MSFEHISLARRLALAVGIPIVGLVLLSSVSIHSLHTASQEFHDLAMEDKPLAEGVLIIDGRLMDQEIEFQRALRLSHALKAQEPGAREQLTTVVKTFDALADTSNRDFDKVRTVLAATKDDSDPAVVATYAALERDVAQIDKLQTAFETEARQIFGLIAEGRHDDAMAGMHRAESAATATEKAIADFVDKVNRLIHDNVDQARQIDRQATLLTIAIAILATLLGSLTGWWATRSVTRQIGGEPHYAAGVVRQIAAGNLAVDVRTRAGDTDSLLAALRDMSTSLIRTVSAVRDNAEGVASASTRIAQGSLDLSQRTEEQARALGVTAATMEQLDTTVRHNADSAQQANQLARSASDVAAQGGDVMGEVIDSMRGISDSSRKIAEIIGVIDSIAFQTNLLALNAAVEAARAGEQGRGFAVVAAEVRNLAQRSAEAAREIRQLISTSVERVEQGSTLVDRAGLTMREVVSAIQRVSGIVGEISAASSEQAIGVAQIGQTMTQMDQMTQQNASLVGESSAAAEGLKVQANQLVQAVATFRLSSTERS